MGALRSLCLAGKICDFAMSFDAKYRKAIEELQASKIWRANQDQPLNKLYRKIGLNVPPPHYAAFGHVFLAHGVFFSDRVDCAVVAKRFSMARREFWFHRRDRAIGWPDLFFGHGGLLSLGS